MSKKYRKGKSKPTQTKSTTTPNQPNVPQARKKSNLKPLIIWLATVAFLSLWPLEDFAFPIFSWGDKAVHFILYAITTALFFVVLKDKKASSPINTLLMASVLFASGYGLLMEFAQGMTTYRFFSLSDALANALGAVVSAIALWYNATTARTI